LRGETPGSLAGDLSLAGEPGSCCCSWGGLWLALAGDAAVDVPLFTVRKVFHAVKENDFRLELWIRKELKVEQGVTKKYLS
jgi:hypothetical protein